MTDADPVLEVETALTEHPELGDTARIVRRVAARYDLGLQSGKPRSEAVDQLVEASRPATDAQRERVLWHPVVRNAVHDFMQTEADRSPVASRAERVLALAGKLLRRSTPALDFVDRLWNARGSGCFLQGLRPAGRASAVAPRWARTGADT